jgi:hypothetical protein
MVVLANGGGKGSIKWAGNVDVAQMVKKEKR